MKNALKVDDIDLQIIDALVENGELSCAQIAQKIGGITERSIRYRKESLLKNKAMRIIAIPDPLTLGFEVTADVLIETEPGHVFQVGKELVKHDCVVYVGCSTGGDVSIEIILRDVQELSEFIAEVVGTIPGVRKITTSIVPIVFKEFSYKVRQSFYRSPNKGQALMEFRKIKDER